LHLLLAGRDRQKLQATQKILGSNPAAKTDVVPCDIGSGLLESLHSRRPDAVIHLAGPFQAQDYGVARACLQARVPYMDMADGREFVAQFSSLDAAAREKGIPLITGASTVPGLSAAIIDATLREFSQLQAIDYGISAALQSGLGAATLRAVLSYCGKPYEILEDGKRTTVYGLGRPRYHDFPTPLNRRFIVDCDIPESLPVSGAISKPKTDEFRQLHRFSGTPTAAFGDERLRA
jgi:saccharopine dehydrogenase-like NADP-dependent oxidoreductase